MKRIILIAALAVTGLMSVQAQDANDTFIKIESNNIYSQCFEMCDTNKDGIVTYAEAAAATTLSMEKGGRLNIIDNYDFLKYFPNLEMFSVGNTPLEVIDMHYQTKLKEVNVPNALWLKKIIVGGEIGPEVTGEIFDENNINKESVKVEFWVEDPVVRSLFYDEGYNYVESIPMDGETYYIVSKNDTGGPYGLWHNGKLEVPCEYGLDVLKENYYTLQQRGASNDFIVFKDDGIRDFCIDWYKTIDANKNGQVSVEEAKAVKELSLMCFKSFIRFIKTYDDLKYFPNLEYFHAGTSYAEKIDLSGCPKLKKLDLSDCRMLKTIVLAKGCKPEIKYPVAYKGEQAKIEYK